MLLCCMCEQRTVDNKLCYLHQKYKDRITGPYFDSLFDYMWFKETFEKRWNWKVRTQLLVSLSPKLERKLDQRPDLVREMERGIKKHLESGALKYSRVWEYAPLVYSTAHSFGGDTEDLIQQGMGFLSSIDRATDWLKLTAQQISGYIKKSLIGHLLNYLNKRKIPTTSLVEDEYLLEQEGQDVALLKKEDSNKLYSVIDSIQWSELEAAIITDYILAEKPKTLQDIAGEHSTYIVQVFRIKEEILNTLKEGLTD